MVLSTTKMDPSSSKHLLNTFLDSNLCLSTRAQWVRADLEPRSALLCQRLSGDSGSIRVPRASSPLQESMDSSMEGQGPKKAGIIDMLQTTARQCVLFQIGCVHRFEVPSLGSRTFTGSWARLLPCRPTACSVQVGLENTMRSTLSETINRW